MAPESEDLPFLKSDLTLSVLNRFRFQRREGFPHLLSGLEGLTRVTRADSLDISSIGTTDNGKIQVVINTLNFFKSTPSIKSNVDQKVDVLSPADKSIIDRIKSTITTPNAIYNPIFKGSADPFE